MTSKVTSNTGSVGWSALTDASVSEQTVADQPAATEEEPAPPEAAAPGSSTALYDLFRSLPASGGTAPADGTDAPAPRNNDWLQYVNLPTIPVDNSGDD